MSELKFSEVDKEKVRDKIISYTKRLPCELYPELGECWIWQRNTLRGGYGQTCLHRKMMCSHRASYAAFVDAIPDGLCVCHKCDTPGCCNPEHLFIGTYLDNNLDRKNKGRSATGDRSGARIHREKWKRGDEHHARKNPECLCRGDDHWTRKRPESMARGDDHWTRSKPEMLKYGESNKKSKFTNEQVIEMRRLRKAGMTLVALAEIYGVAFSSIHRIVTMQTWRHIQGD